MFNSEKPSHESRPGSTNNLRPTLLAALVAITFLLVVILPAEYGKYPTGYPIGTANTLNITEMGEIKLELATESEEDQINHANSNQGVEMLDNLIGLFISTAHADETWKDTITFTLEPGASLEIKLIMDQDAVSEYQWNAENGRIDFELFGHGEGETITYKKGQGEVTDTGTFKAPVPGEHGWLWRNLDEQAVTVVLQLRGEYTEVLQ